MTAPAGRTLLLTVLATIASSFLALVTASVFYFFQPPTNPDVPLIVEPLTEPACSTASASEINNCCRAWAEDNQIMTVRCAGSWELQDSQCTWVCTQN